MSTNEKKVSYTIEGTHATVCEHPELDCVVLHNRPPSRGCPLCRADAHARIAELEEEIADLEDLIEDARDLVQELSWKLEE